MITIDLNDDGYISVSGYEGSEPWFWIHKKRLTIVLEHDAEPGMTVEQPMNLVCKERRVHVKMEQAP